MTAGRHAADFTVGEVNGEVLLGLARPGVDVNETRAWHTCTDKFLGIHDDDGCIYTGEDQAVAAEYDGHSWDEMEGFEKDDIVGLLLDCDTGTLTVKKNGVRLGVAATGVTRRLCWAASMSLTDMVIYHNDYCAVRVSAVDADAF
jgi:hypothetical protein